jgi:hypothetical protein
MATGSVATEAPPVKRPVPTTPAPAEQHEADPPVAPADTETVLAYDLIGLWVWLISMLILLGLGLVLKFVYYFGQV